MFNALKYTKRLEEVGFSREQAEAQLQVRGDALEGDLVTKQDFELNTKMDASFDRLQTRIDHLASIIKFWLMK